MTKSGEKFLKRFVGAIIAPFLSSCTVWLIYGHFAARFGWPALSYWEVFFALLMLGAIGFVAVPHVVIERHLEDILESKG